MGLVRRAQQQQRRRQCAASDDYDVRRVLLGASCAFHLHAVDDAPGSVGVQFRYIGVGLEGDIGVGPKGGVHAHHLSIRLAVQWTRKAVEGIAADAGAGGRRLAVLLVEQDAEGQMKRLQTFATQAPRSVFGWRARAIPAGTGTARPRAARSDPRRADRARGTVARPRRNRARKPRTAAAMRARSRPRAAPPRNRVRASAATRRHRPWSCRRRSNEARGEIHARRLRTRFPWPGTRRRRIPPANPSSRGSAEGNPRVRESGSACRSRRACAPGRRRPDRSR